MVISRKRDSVILLAVVAALFFLSGAAGLIYQTVWVRLLEMYFGVTLTAISVIVSAYMAGLGLGSLLGGRIAIRISRPVLLFSILQGGIGIFGFFSPALINMVGQHTAGSPYFSIFLLSFSLFLIPTTFMGMTLPLLVQAFVKDLKKSGSVVGLLYGINILGASIGAFASGYFLIGYFGFNGALGAAFLLNIFVGLSSLWIGLRINTHHETTEIDVSHQASRETRTWHFQAVLISAFLVGFIGMSFEMFWFRLLGVIGKNTAYNFPSILFVFLGALALSGLYWGRKADRSQNTVRLFWRLQLSIGVVTALSFLAMWSLLHFPPFEHWLESGFFNYRQPTPPFVSVQSGDLNAVIVFSRIAFLQGLLEYFFPILVMVLPGALLMGGSLPILDRIAIDRAVWSGRRVGDIHLANIIGSVSGVLGTSYVLLPGLGSEGTIKLLCLLTSAYLGLVVLTKKTQLQKREILMPVFLLMLVLVMPGRAKFYQRLYQVATEHDNIAIQESADGVLAITFRAPMQDPSGLYIDGLQNSFFPSKGEYESPVMTCAAAASPERVLIIGMGGGNSAKFVAQIPGVTEIIIVELMGGLGEFLNLHVPAAQFVFSQPQVRYVVDDGRRFLYANPDERFDLIFIDPLFSYTAGHNNLYSREAMELYKKHLSEGGIFCAWVNEGHFIPKTAASVFQYSDFFGFFMVNSEQPIQYDLDKMKTLSDIFLNNLPSDLLKDAADLMTPERVMNRKMGNQTTILESENLTPVLTDMTPWLEYFYFCPPHLLKSLSNQQLQYCLR